MTSGSGQLACDAVLALMKQWECDPEIIGMCFDTTASNTGKLNGACTLIEAAMGRKLLWLTCRHHMFEVLLADVFRICFGPSTGPEILLFKRLRDKWPELNHHVPRKLQTPLIIVHDELKTFIKHCQLEYPRDDYREMICLAAFVVCLETKYGVRRPGGLHRARWMAKAIYSLKIELLLDGNEDVLHLVARELQGVKRFNRFVVNIYLLSWFTCRFSVDAPLNDILLIQRLSNYDDEAIKTAGLKMMKRHSWYLSPELATLSLFSPQVTIAQKKELVQSMKSERGEHLLKVLPGSITELTVSRSFFDVCKIDASFLDIPVEGWLDNACYKIAEQSAKNIVCVNDVAEQGVALIQTFNGTITKDEEQKQYLLQVIEKHRHEFRGCNRDSLIDM